MTASTAMSVKNSEGEGIDRLAAIEALATLIEKPQDRAKGAATAIEAVGGKLHHYFFSFGEYDIAIIAEVPDNVSMAGIAMAVATTGTVTDSRTTILMTAAEGMEAMRQGQKVTAAYRPPARWAPERGVRHLFPR